MPKKEKDKAKADAQTPIEERKDGSTSTVMATIDNKKLTTTMRNSLAALYQSLQDKNGKFCHLNLSKLHNFLKKEQSRMPDYSQWSTHFIWVSFSLLLSQTFHTNLNLYILDDQQLFYTFLKYIEEYAYTRQWTLEHQITQQEMIDI